MQDRLPHTPEELFAGPSEMAALMRAKDWSRTPLGPLQQWPQSLRTAVSICLESRFPLLIWWGPQLIKLYNDAYRQIIAGKHPSALGSPGRAVWPEIWDVIGPMLEGVLREGNATWSENQLLMLHRHGYAEECYFTFSYSPIRDESGGVGGVFTAVYEVTDQVLAARRMVTLRNLAAHAADAATTRQACASTIAVLARNPADIPYAHLLLGRGEELIVEATTTQRAPALSGEAASRIRSAAARGLALVDARELGDLAALTGDAAKRVAVLPLAPRASGEPEGYLVAGTSRHRVFDTGYRNFLELVGGHVSTAMVSARAREDEQRRLDSLAELDRAKTTFFSNVSHEFRTPLTLMLGPVEEMLEPASAIPAQVRERLEVVHRQGLRLLKLVNTLLNFSRLEAGRALAHYVPTDLAALTAELASMFRPVTEKAGLTLTVDCEPLDSPVYVDRDMWEKIVLNLLSNAFKFTLQGSITVRLIRVGDRVELTVSDTGSGIPEAELPNLFTRFHRVERTRRRTHEGTGIGLALVQELTKLHGGSVAVESEDGRGSTFTVSIPLGADHLPQDHVQLAAPATGALSAAPKLFVAEAMQWLNRGSSHEADEPGEPVLEPPMEGARPRILLVDDNADLRDYVRRLLAPRYDVTTAPDGAAALDLAMAMTPDLVVTDVMMPVMDGFQLLEALRKRPETATIPIIMLSARAGEEARVDGLAAGADDYIVKPFSARELQTRVDNLLVLARVRRDADRAIRESEERYRSLVEASAAIVWRTPANGESGPQEGWQAFTGQGAGDVQGSGWLDAVHPDDRPMTIEHWRRSIAGGQPYELEHRVRGADGEYRHMLARAVPVREADGSVREWIGIHMDVTNERRLQQILENERIALRTVFMRAPTFVATLRGPEHVFEVANPMYMRLIGEERDIIGKPVREALPEIGDQGFFDLLDTVYATGEPYAGNEVRVSLRRGGRTEERFLDFIYQPMHGADGSVSGIFVHGVDVTDKVRARRLVEQQAAELERANRSKDEFLATLSHELRTPLTAILGWSHMLRLGVTDPETTRMAIETIDQSAQIQVQLIDDVLDLSRIASGKVRIEPTLVDVADVARRALDGVRLAATARGVNLEDDLDAAPEPFLVLGDPNRLQQAIWNLLTNAIKFTPKNGRISLSIRRVDGSVVISVSDTGIGIAPEFLPHVFEPFRQAETPTTRVHGGLGLGLAIVRHMVQLHGGSITATSEGEGRGATFAIELPAARSIVPLGYVPGSAATAANRIDGDFADLNGATVLVIDDDASVADLLASVLRHCGASVDMASSVEDGITVMQRHRPDVVVCDIAMPEQDGFDFARWVGSNPAAQGIPLVAVTAFGRPGEEQRTIDAGFVRHVRKPIDPAHLSRTIAGLVRKRGGGGAANVERPNDGVSGPRV